MKVERVVTTEINAVSCTGCGLCVRVCPEETISFDTDNRKACVTGSESLNCGHCEAVCPAAAVRVRGIDPSLSNFKTFETQDVWLPHGGMETDAFVRLARSRRSCRNYTTDPVRRDTLEDLVKIGITAPSGSNCQKWTFTILPDRSSVVALAEKTLLFFKKLNKMAEKQWLRKTMKLFGKPELEDYYQAYYESVADGISKYENENQDLLFHGATAAILAGSRLDASCPAEDALLATQNILLGAHCLGLGTCLIGFVTAAMREDKSIARSLGIPGNEKVYAVIALGHPDEKYQRVTGRKQAVIRYSK